MLCGAERRSAAYAPKISPKRKNISRCKNKDCEIVQVSMMSERNQTAAIICKGERKAKQVLIRVLLQML
jgi:hypothetical protein